MILVWDDARSFQRHLEDMGRFRRSHKRTAGTTGSFHDLPAIFDVDPGGTGAQGIFATIRGRPAVVPVWDIEPPPGSQN